MKKYIYYFLIIITFIIFFCGCSVNRNVTMNNNMRSITVSNELLKPHIIAHRGFWSLDGSAENSIKSLQAAADLEIYGSEFDVHLTADNIPVVYHDRYIKDTNIDIHKVTYKEIKNVVLSNGEKLNTLDNYLKAGKKLPIKLILEIKEHLEPERDRKAAQIIAGRVKYFNLEKKVDYITFSLEVGKELIRIQPDSNVGYLNGDLTPAEIKEYGFHTLSYNYEVIQSHLEYINEAIELGLSTAVWTVNDLLLMEILFKKGIRFITTDIPLQAIEYFMKK